MLNRNLHFLSTSAIQAKMAYMDRKSLKKLSSPVLCQIERPVMLELLGNPVVKNSEKNVQHMCTDHRSTKNVPFMSLTINKDREQFDTLIALTHLWFVSSASKINIFFTIFYQVFSSTGHMRRSTPSQILLEFRSFRRCGRDTLNWILQCKFISLL